MKKLFLLMAAGVVAFNVDAQYKTAFSVRNAPEVSGKSNKVFRQAQPAHSNNTASKPTLGGSRWYHHNEISAEYVSLPTIYDAALTNAYYLWQDSTVTYPAPDNTVGIQFLSVGEVMHPQAPIFNEAAISSNNGLIAVKTEPYKLDSITIRGFYDRVAGATYDDTLIFTIVRETAAQQHAFFSYAGSVFADHGVDSFCAQLFSIADWNATNSINQTGYGQNGNFMTDTTFKVVLTQAIYADSTQDGYHFISIAPNLPILANRKASVSVTFKSGAAYTAGTSIDNYSNFLVISYETAPGGFVNYSPDDFNMSSFAPKDTQLVNATLGLYVPTIAYTAPLGGELHDVAFKVTCTTCALVGATKVGDVSAAEVSDAFPNPANNTITIPFTMNQTSNVNVVVTNAVGATLASQNLGKYNAKQSGNAKFNVANFANGVYFYTVEADGQRTTKRFVVAH